MSEQPVKRLLGRGENGAFAFPSRPFRSITYGAVWAIGITVVFFAPICLLVIALALLGKYALTTS